MQCFPLAHLKQGGPPGLNLEHQSKWVGLDVMIELKAHEVPSLDSVPGEIPM